MEPYAEGDSVNLLKVQREREREEKGRGRERGRETRRNPVVVCLCWICSVRLIMSITNAHMCSSLSPPNNLFKMLDDDFEMLENDQLAVQSMMSSRYIHRIGL